MKNVFILILMVVGSLIPLEGDSSTDTIPYYMFKASKAFNVDIDLLYAFCRVESKCKSDAINRDDGNKGAKASGKHVHSHGLFQIQLGTAKHLGFNGTYKELMKPEINTWYAAKLIRQLIDRYEELPLVISAYNAGHPIEGNKKYVHLVLKNYMSHKLIMIASSIGAR